MASGLDRGLLLSLDCQYIQRSLGAMPLRCATCFGATGDGGTVCSATVVGTSVVGETSDGTTAVGATVQQRCNPLLARPAMVRSESLQQTAM